MWKFIFNYVRNYNVILNSIHNWRHVLLKNFHHARMRTQYVKQLSETGKIKSGYVILSRNRINRQNQHCWMVYRFELEIKISQQMENQNLTNGKSKRLVMLL